MSSFPNSTHKKKNKRRFSDEQIKSLESIFESESKLEPMKKMELAKELGLQPRQIAIWFQNRRARWKSKQLEQDYCILKANYDNLAVEFESLKQEKQSLVTQMENLLGKAREVGNSTDGESENGDVKVEFDRKPSLSSEEGTKIRVITSSNNENGQDIEYLKQERENGVSVINVTENVDGVLTSPENWCNSTSCGLFDQPCSSSSQWWDFWS